MAKKWFTSTMLATAVAAGTYYLGKEENREKLQHNYNRMKAKFKNETKEDHEPYLEEKVGHSDPNDEDDNSMVGEGAVYSVNYYNKTHKND
ncbi:hypothetical protein CR203_10485 [Salipaludibacillus neizhouensis]|uniref:Uncharacterized protein n=1 Tax=Salipaludibacillus neizhouensis TaxID=885475 RepID=A0A3A9KDP2_9BACI|nr:hypothetical protein [Salipaludibacillus neizhouensis]RKL67763.1 hypothetical protein CR203_10485 [Salipaludibacillus neizhouensis]